MRYKDALIRGAQIIWHKQSLVIIGFVAAFFGPGRIFTFLRSWTLTPGDLTGSYLQNLIWTYDRLGVFQAQTLQGLGQLSQSNPGRLAVIITIFLIAIGLVIFLAWLSSIAQNGLVNSLRQLHDNRDVKVRREFFIGKKSAWTVWTINLLNRLVWVTLGVLLWGLLARNEYFFGFTELGIFLLALIIGMLTSAIARLAILNAASHNDSIGHCLSLALAKVKRNFKMISGLAIVTLVVEGLVILTATALIAALNVPMATIIGATTYLSSSFLFTSSLIFANVVNIAIEILTLAALTVFVWSLWVEAWEELN
ncbi:MAG: hypothetical protein COT81_03090 [Candidatus Buchananbacteria bacterium CG10_big_fil_rev_8_21_14_0_10_42_9]|uniref:Glycerophosphoryl diester phosphodiesterase membrane domain-containing protein n=1 Tax=Candidatus Buchananbacteria bacterium CG10_big_fil_rev_8_21_14_0_10_42_9 TaxID=1974526 RepID=A0A2H0W137_9BACT|nr:MAG: hypothetical protein COT81_03090 [Candidatus Buchananbacteria bacterium CG10_big_fil_rev_8_21_14_0_10_42_9]